MQNNLTLGNMHDVLLIDRFIYLFLKYPISYYNFLGSALPLYTAMWVSTDDTKVNTTSTEARLAPGSCTCVQRTAFYRVVVIFTGLCVCESYSIVHRSQYTQVDKCGQ